MSHGIDGSRSGLSPSARSFAIDSSSLILTAEHEDSIWGDYTLDLSFLSSDDSVSNYVETTKEDKIVLLNPNPLIESSTVSGDDNLDLSCANTTVKSSTDSEEDSPCWIGINSRNRSTDDLSGFHRLNTCSNTWSGEFNLTEDGRDDAGNRTSILTHIADEHLGFVSRDCVSKTSDTLQSSKRLDPLAPVFVPSTPSAFETNAHSTSALTYSDNKSLGKVKVDTSSGEAGRIHKSSSYNPWFESKFGSSSNKSPGQRRLNPLARQFSLADTKPKEYTYEKYQAADDLSLLANTSPLTGYTEHDVVDAQSSVYVEGFLPTAESNFGSTKWFAVEPNTTLSVNGNQDFQHPLPFHVVETAATSSSSDVKALSPKMDVKKLLTTIHGLSELLTLAHGSESSDVPDADEVDLINSTVQNLNSYIAVNQSVLPHNSYDLKLFPNKNRLSIRDLQLPRTNNMTVDLDVKRKEKYYVVSGETVPDSRLYQYGVTKDNGFGQVVATSGYQQNHLGEEQINQHALFYKSLWLKAEADRCLMVYETSLSNPGS